MHTPRTIDDVVNLAKLVKNGVLQHGIRQGVQVTSIIVTPMRKKPPDRYRRPVRVRAIRLDKEKAIYLLLTADSTPTIALKRGFRLTELPLKTHLKESLVSHGPMDWNGRINDEVIVQEVLTAFSKQLCRLLPPHHWVYVEYKQLVA